MNDKFISDRITQLRLAKGDSEYHVSLEIGRSRTYIGMITSGKAVPSMRVFWLYVNILISLQRNFLLLTLRRRFQKLHRAYLN